MLHICEMDVPFSLQQQSNHSMLGVHASAQAIIHFGKIARKHNLTGVCLDSLSRYQYSHQCLLFFLRHIATYAELQVRKNHGLT